MPTKIFVNLPVKDLNRSVDFFTKLNFTFNPQFTNENATCMIVGEDIFVMLLVEDYFKSFTKKEINDTRKSAEVITSLSAESREKVDKLVNTALQSGGKPSIETQDHGWMYTRGFQDLDGHLWEFAFLDISKMQQS